MNTRGQFLGEDPIKLTVIYTILQIKIDEDVSRGYDIFLPGKL